MIRNLSNYLKIKINFELIFVLSDKFDTTTNDILKWFTFYDVSFFRLNYQDKIENFYVEISNEGKPWFHIETQNGSLNSNDVSFFFYRRGELLFNHSTNIFPEEDINRHIEIHLKNDIRDIRSVIKRILVESVPRYGDYLEDRVNKLELLLTAKEKFDIRIPFTCITNYKKGFAGKNFSFITKGISDNISAESSFRNLSLGVYTNELGIGYDDPNFFSHQWPRKKSKRHLRYVLTSSRISTIQQQYFLK